MKSRAAEHPTARRLSPAHLLRLRAIVRVLGRGRSCVARLSTNEEHLLDALSPEPPPFSRVAAEKLEGDIDRVSAELFGEDERRTA